MKFYTIYLEDQTNVNTADNEDTKHGLPVLWSRVVWCKDILLTIQTHYTAG